MCREKCKWGGVIGGFKGSTRGPQQVPGEHLVILERKKTFLRPGSAPTPLGEPTVLPRAHSWWGG